jgi:very-short-patch-repair endonuclease
MLGCYLIPSSGGARGGFLKMKRKIIPYDPKLKVLAKKLRHNMTFSEVVLWNELKTGQMMEYDFDRQRPILKYIVDFYCKDVLLAIEIDGSTHDDDVAAMKDEVRQKELEKLGVSFLRFNALDVVHDIINVLRTIENWLFDYEDKYGISENVKRKRNSTS